VLESSDPYLAERAAEILGAARAVFVRQGFERATMQEIASEAGLSAGAIYRYFPGKESLITAVCGAAHTDYMTAFDEGAAGRSALDVLVDGGAAIWKAMFDPENADALRMNLEATIAAIRHPESIGDEYAREMAGELDQLAALVARAQSEGSLRDDFDARSLSALLLAATEGMQVLNGQLQGDVDTGGAWEVLVRMIAGLQPEQPARESEDGDAGLPTSL
jgi:AcrR family transcriptional regulator